MEANDVPECERSGRENKGWWLRNLEEILQRREKCVEVEDCDVSPACPPGENFVADVFRVVVYGKRLCLGVWTDFRKNFIVKRIPEENSCVHKLYDCVRFFENEITAYEHVLPLWQSYLKKKARNEMNGLCFPRYFGQSRAFLVLDDLQTQGYQIVNRVKGFSKKECSVILKELSRFHAVSFVLKKNERVVFSDAANRLKETVFREEHLDGKMGVLWENSLKFAIRSLRECDDLRLKRAWEKLVPFSGKVLGTLINLSRPELTKYDVICHGDLWNNNIMLRCCELGYPVGVKLIDLQAMRCGSCVLDVMHVLFTSSRPAIQEIYLERLLSEYYDALVENLENLDEAPEFTFDEFRSEFKSKIFFGIFVASIMFTCLTRTSSPDSYDVNLTTADLASDSEVEKMYKSLNSGYHERLRALFVTLTQANLI